MAGGPCTGQQSRPPTFLDIPSVSVDGCIASCRPVRPRCTCLWASARPPAFPGVPHTLASENFIGINFIEKEGIQGGRGDNKWVVWPRQIPRPWNPTRACHGLQRP